MFAALFAALFALLATVADPPAPVVQPAPAPVVVVAPASAPGGNRGPSAPSPAGRLDGGVSRLPQPTPAPETVPACEAGEEWQGDLGCVAVQLPDETTGRAYGPAD
jgi:hypothetical protein